MSVLSDCLKSLDISESRIRIKDVHEAHDKTFQWLFEPSSVSFHQWLRGDGCANTPVFWIQGHPGSGKSTLMKFAMRHPKTLELLGNGTTGRWTLIAFFFHDRGSDIQRSLDGMMQEILHSILQQHPSLLSIITPLYVDLAKYQRVKIPKWDTLTLKTALRTIARERQPRLRLCLFIDALDEHGGDNEELALLLKEMVDNTDSGTVKIKMCVASRSWSVFTKHFGNCPGFEIHKHTLEDISSYTKSRLTVDHLGSQPLLDEEQQAVIVAQVTQKSSGVFIWVRLVVDQLSKDIRDGTAFRDLENRVMEMPRELEDLYAHTLRRIEPDYCNESYTMLQIALCSISPLSLQAFMECTSYNREPLDLFVNLGTRVTENTSLDSQLRRLASRTGGLLESISSTPWSSTEKDRNDWQTKGYHVQFIHQTVKEYVRKYQHNLRLPNLSNRLQRRSGYYYLLSPNAAYHGFSETSHAPPWALPLRKDLFTYAKLLESSIDPLDTPSYTDILEQTARYMQPSDISLWLPDGPPSFSELLQRNLKIDGSKFMKNEEVFTAVAVVNNLVLYINKIAKSFSREDWIERMSSWAGSLPLLHLAAAGPDVAHTRPFDHCAMIEALVDRGWPVNQEADLRLRELEPSIIGQLFTSGKITPLACLLRRRDLSSRSEETRLQIARTLLKLGANVKPTILTRYGLEDSDQTLLEYCVRYDTAPFVRLLLQHGAPQDTFPHPSLGYLRFLGAIEK